MPRKGFSKQPSPYPRAGFHLSRVLQFLSAAVVIGVIAYFDWFIIDEEHENGIPWQFFLVILPFQPLQGRYLIASVLSWSQ